MKWINRDPNFLPVEARGYAAFHITAISLIFMFKIGIVQTLAACGIVLGVFGAGVLYWETVATDQNLQSVSHELARVGGSTKLSFGENASVIALCHLGLVLFVLYSSLLVLIAKYNPNQLRLPAAVCIGLLFIFFAVALISTYGLIKTIRRLCSRWLERIRVSQGDTRKAQIKAILRLIGNASVILAGWAQLPAILISPH
jgi:hypothetical protein